jgi:ParB family chromosome partitioning protein
MEQNFVDVKLDDITLKYRPRQDDGDLTALQESIERVGLLCPITIDVDNVLIAGARRLAACRNLGKETISACRLGIRANSLRGLDIQSDENICRLPLSSAELSAHIDRKKKFAARGAEGGGLRRIFAGLGRLFRR